MAVPHEMLICHILCATLRGSAFLAASDRNITMPASPQYVSTSQAAERLAISREHVRRLIQQGELRAEERVNGFTVDVREVERFAAERRLRRDQREFRSAVNDLAAQARRVEGADAIVGAVAALRDEMKRHSVFELPTVVATQLEWMNQRIATNPALAALREPAKAVTEQWHRMDNEGLARGFVVAESREARLEEKVDELDRKVEQLTELVTRQRADATPEMPTWQQWAGSDRPEDVLAKLAAIREEIAGGKQASENSTDIIREAREARGRDL